MLPNAARRNKEDRVHSGHLTKAGYARNPINQPRIKIPHGYGHREAVYDLAKYAAKGLVSHKPRQRYYRIVPSAVRVLSAYLIIRERVLKPILAGASRRRLGRPHKNMDSIDQHYLNLRSELFVTLNKLGVAE
jgi:hypothetical protein